MVAVARALGRAAVGAARLGQLGTTTTTTTTTTTAAVASAAVAPALVGRRGMAADATPDTEFDVVVVGGGPGGYVSAIKAAQLGLKTACVEGRGALGGTCLNVGCIPSKALLHSSHLFHEAAGGVMAAHGIDLGGVVPKIDVPAMMAHKATAVKGLTTGIEGLFKKNKVTYLRGWGSLSAPASPGAPPTVVVAPTEGAKDGQPASVTATKGVVLATGSEVSPLPGVEIDEERIVSSTGALELKEVPKRLVVIGAGVIGLEMGSVWSRLGSDVTVVEFAAAPIAFADVDIQRTFKRTMEKQGIKFEMSTRVVSAARKGDVVELTVADAKSSDCSTERVIEADVVLVATGRRPFTKGLGLESVGVTPNKRGQVEVDSHFATSVPGLFAIGDVVPGPMLAHKAEEDGVAVAENLAGLSGHVNYNTVPSIIYTNPEVASVGLTEAAAKAEVGAVKVGKFSFAANSRARAVDTAEGFVKMISCAATDKLLGVHILGPNAGELIAECVLAMEYGGSAEDIARACHGHPTLSEAVKEAALAVGGKPIHM